MIGGPPTAWPSRPPTRRPLTLATLHPGNFALVMASGIISIGFGTLGFEALADAMYVFALGAWIALLALSVARTVLHARAVRTDLLNPRMVFAYFTLVAATDIVGLLLHDRGHMELAMACWAFAFMAWCSLLYLAFSVLTFLTHEHNVNIVHGGWLISIVGTQSLVLLGARIAPDLGSYAGYMMVEVHMLWGLGLLFYGIFVTLFCYRIFFLTLKPQDVSPLLWVIMGAAAISANAGTTLLAEDPVLPFLASQRPFIDGVTDDDLGLGHLVDSDADPVRDLEARREPSAARATSRSCGASSFRWACMRSPAHGSAWPRSFRRCSGFRRS